MFETTLTVPTHQLPELTKRLAKAGFTILDTGDRVATDDGWEAEACVRLIQFAQEETPLVCELGISR